MKPSKILRFSPIMKFPFPMNRASNWFPLFGLLLVSPASAQEPAAPAPADAKPVMPAGQPLPKIPLLARAPVRAEWTVRISSDLSDAERNDPRAAEAGMTNVADEARTIRSVDVSKDGQLQTYRFHTRWSDGANDDEWIVAGQHVAERAGGKGLYIVGSEGSTAQDLRASDFPELNWLDMSYYRGMKVHKGGKVFVFSVPYDKRPMSRADAQLLMLARQSDPSMTASKLFKPKAQEVFIYLDAATQLPVLFNDGSTLRSYTFKQASEPRLYPSKEIVDFLNKRQRALQAKLATPPGP